MIESLIPGLIGFLIGLVTGSAIGIVYVKNKLHREGEKSMKELMKSFEELGNKD